MYFSDVCCCHVYSTYSMMYLIVYQMKQWIACLRVLHGYKYSAFDSKTTGNRKSFDRSGKISLQPSESDELRVHVLGYTMAALTPCTIDHEYNDKHYEAAKNVPRPLSLMPPNGICACEIRPVFVPTIPTSSASATLHTLPTSLEKKYPASP